LEERAEFANEHNADLFISIHCNACPNHRLHGVETYSLDVNTNNPFISKTSGDVNVILEDLIRAAKLDESKELANYVQKSIIRNLKRRYRYINDLGIKEAAFYVLFGTRMPSILVETSFISNPRENRRLRNRNYRRLIAYSISKGIINYIKNQKFVK
jgi:N-acetylmuramoyl-L-alanine amidase